jgi:hypothetical protein
MLLLQQLLQMQQIQQLQQAAGAAAAAAAVALSTAARRCTPSLGRDSLSSLCVRASNNGVEGSKLAGAQQHLNGNGLFLWKGMFAQVHGKRRMRSINSVMCVRACVRACMCVLHVLAFACL